MKRISILLIAFLLLGSFAFAQEFEPSVTLDGSASLTFGADLEEGTTGFSNAATATLTLELVPTDTAVSGDAPVTGRIELAGFGISISGAEVTHSAGAITAWIVAEPVQLKIYSAPTLEFDSASSFATLRDIRAGEDALNAVEPGAATPAYDDEFNLDNVVFTDVKSVFEVDAEEGFADTIDTDDEDALDGLADTLAGFSVVVDTEGNVWDVEVDDDGDFVQVVQRDDPANTLDINEVADEINAGNIAFLGADGTSRDDLVASYQGFTLTLPAGPVNVNLDFASVGTWVENVDNLYSLGLSVDGEIVEGISGKVGGFVGPFGGADDYLAYGFTSMISASIDIVSVTAAMDGVFDTDETFNWDASLGLGVDLDVVAVSVDSYVYTEDEEISDDLRLRLGIDAGGLDPGLDLALGFETQDTLADEMLWAADVSLGYDVMGIRPFADYVLFNELDGGENVMDLTVGLGISNIVPNTVFTLQYEGTDIGDDTDTGRGSLVTFDTTVSF